MSKLIGYARVSTRPQSTERQELDLLAAGVRRDDLYVDRGVSGARASRPQFDQAFDALQSGDTLVITTLDRLGRSTQSMLAFSDKLRGLDVGLRVLNLGGGEVDTSTPMGSMLFTIMAALAQMEYDIKRERITEGSIVFWMTQCYQTSIPRNIKPPRDRLSSEEGQAESPRNGESGDPVILPVGEKIAQSRVLRARSTEGPQSAGTGQPAYRFEGCSSAACASAASLKRAQRPTCLMPMT